MIRRCLYFAKQTGCVSIHSHGLKNVGFGVRNGCPRWNYGRP
jgi:hypothetical protein